MLGKFPYILTFLLFIAFNTIFCAEEKQHFFYDRTGVLNIDGTVAGTSEPITVDMNVERLNCAKRRTFALAFCPDREAVQNAILSRNQSSPCQDGITFCYVPILSEKFAKEEFVLETFEDLDPSKKCGKLFRGFQVAFRFMLNEKYEKRLYYEIQLSYMREPYYFEMPDSMCIKILLGNKVNLLTTISDMNGDILRPAQVRLSKNNFELIGISAEQYQQNWPDTNNLEPYREKPSLKMLFLDFKSFELESQMMFTVGSKYQCKMYARLQNTIIDQYCYSRFRQKLMALRPFGQNTTTIYKMSIESGVLTNDTTMSKSIINKILDREFEEETANEEQRSDIFEGIQSHNENVEKISEKQLDYQLIKNEKNEEDTTPWWKKAGAWLVNKVTAVGCSAIKLADSSCEGNLEFRDTKTSTFHESYTKTQIKNKKTTNSFASFHSVQNTLQTVFTHSRGDTETTMHTKEYSMSNAVSKRTIIQISIQVPAGKVITPMQMSVDCDGNSVKIPWLKFRLSDEGSDELVEEYEMDGNNLEIEEKLDEYIENGDEILKDISEQEKMIEQAFSPKPNFQNGDEILKAISVQQKTQPIESNDDAAEEADEYLQELRDNNN